MRSLFRVANGYSSVNQQCLKKFKLSGPLESRDDMALEPTPDHTMRTADLPKTADPTLGMPCLYPEHFADLIDTPLFVAHSLFDESEIYATLDINCNVEWLCGDSEKQRSTNRYGCCSEAEILAIRGLRGLHLQNAGMEGFQRKRFAHGGALQNGYFFPSCIVHTMLGDYWLRIGKADGPRAPAWSLESAVASWVDHVERELVLQQRRDSRQSGGSHGVVDLGEPGDASELYYYYTPWRVLDAAAQWALNSTRKQCWDRFSSSVPFFSSAEALLV
jgi:hypothetical protein